MRPPALRQRLVLATCAAVAAGLAVLTVAFHVVLQHRLDADANSVLRSRAQAALATVAVHRDGRLTVTETSGDTLLDERVWVFQGARAVERPFASGRIEAAVAQLAAKGKYARHDAEPDTRLLAQPVRQHGRTVGMVVAAGMAVAVAVAGMAAAAGAAAEAAAGVAPGSGSASSAVRSPGRRSPTLTTAIPTRTAMGIRATITAIRTNSCEGAPDGAPFHFPATMRARRSSAPCRM